MWEWLADATVPVSGGNLLTGILTIFILGVCLGIVIAARWDGK